MIKFIK